MKRVKFRGLAAGAAGIILLGGLTACGSSPDDADKDEFCDTWDNGSLFLTDDFDEIEKAAEDLEDIGTPEEIDGDARDGFEVLIDLVNDSGDMDELEEKGDDLDSDDEKKVEAFTEKATEVCGGGGEEDATPGTTEPGDTELPSDLPSDVPTELPSDLPSDLPTELPSDFDPSDLESLLSELPSDLPTEIPSE